MTTLHTASLFAKQAGFTHILASDGTITPLEKCKGYRSFANYQFVGGYGYILSIPAKKGYYELVAIHNGYLARYNPSSNRFVVSHDEIGAGLSEFETLESFKEYAERG